VLGVTVVEFCRELGFGEIRELPPDWVRLSPDTVPDLEVLCVPGAEGNSWFAFHTGGSTVLNLNDCGVRNAPEAALIHERVGPVDLLLTQFFYANWFGNPGQRKRGLPTVRRGLRPCYGGGTTIARRSECRNRRPV
jgi:hypothetical protein